MYTLLWLLWHDKNVLFIGKKKCYKYIDMSKLISVYIFLNEAFNRKILIVSYVGAGNHLFFGAQILAVVHSLIL